MFNQPKQAAPPPVAKKPAAFKWKTSGEGIATSQAPASASSSSKTVELPQLPSAPPTPTPASATEDVEPAPLTDKGAPLEAVSSRASVTSAGSASSTTNKSEAGSGLSAADAREKSGSLKDRIAMLSGLKVDQPGTPGRPLKPWKKPEMAPQAEVKASDETAAVDAPSTAPVDLAVDIPKAQAVGLATDTPGEPTSEEMPQLPVPTSPTDNLANVIDFGGPKSPREEPSSSSAITGVALPTMPTRAKGPSRKSKGPAAGGGNSATMVPAASPTMPRPLTNIEQSLEERAPTMEAPTDSFKYSPSAEKKVSTTGEIKDHNEDADPTAEGAEALEASEPLEGLPLSSDLPTVKGAADEEYDEESSEDKEGTVEKEVSEMEENLARQTLDSPSEKPLGMVAESRAASKRPLSECPLNFMVLAVSASQSQEPPRPSPINRRSMNKPPTPGAFQRNPSISSSARSIIDAGAPRRTTSIKDGRQPTSIVREPDPMVGEGEFANLSPDPASTKLSSQIPLSKSFETDTLSTPPKKPIGPRGVPSTLASGLLSNATPPPQPASLPTLTQDSGKPPPQTAAVVETDGPPETNAFAAQGHRPQEEQEDPAIRGDEEYEDPEVARRQALAKRMAAMGGMKIGMMPMFGSPKRQNTQPQESDKSNAGKEVAEFASKAAPASPVRESPTSPTKDIPMSPLAQSSEPRPTPVKRTSHMPPPGAFVLPKIAKASAVHNENAEVPAEAEDQSVSSPSEDVADRTITSDEPEAVTPPPLIAGRPTRILPTPDQSFIDDDTDADSVPSKRASLQSSVGFGSVSDFPAPPGSQRVRTESNISAFSGQEGEPLTEEPEESDLQEVEEQGADADENQDEHEEQLPHPPSRPVRPLPMLSTGGPGTGQDEKDVPASPTASVTSHNQRSMPGTPLSSQGRQDSYIHSSSSPAPSVSSRKSSTFVAAGQTQPTQAGSGNVVQPALTNAYLAWLATSAAKAKTRELDGQLATVINDISYTHRANPANFGQLVYRMLIRGEKGIMPDLQIHGKVETGAVFLAWDAKFDRGLGRSSLKIGSPEVPHIGIVAEDVKDVKKVICL